MCPQGLFFFLPASKITNCFKKQRKTKLGHLFGLFHITLNNFRNVDLFLRFALPSTSPQIRQEKRTFREHSRNRRNLRFSVDGECFKNGVLKLFTGGSHWFDTFSEPKRRSKLSTIVWVEPYFIPSGHYYTPQSYTHCYTALGLLVLVPSSSDFDKYNFHQININASEMNWTLVQFLLTRTKFN